MKKSFVYGLATAMLLAGTSVYAGDLKTWGYGNIWTTLSNNATSSTATDSGVGELETRTAAEVDFEKTVGKTTVRLDVDLNNNPTTLPVTTVIIEQVKLVRSLNDSMSFTGGIFNTPIGLELQDAPDKTTFSSGQLSKLRPANFTGVMFSWWNGPAALDLYAGNDWRGQQAAPQGIYENSIGGQISLSANKIADLKVGYVTSERTKTSPLPTSDGDVLDVVLSTKVKNAKLAFEYLSDDNNDGWGAKISGTHGVHGATLRYDTVENTSNPSAKTEKASLTVAVTCAMWENVGAVLEYRQDDDKKNKNDTVVLQWVAQF